MDHIGTYPDEPAQSVPVFHADSFRAVDGANLGDPISHAGDLIPGDTYMLVPGAKRARLTVTGAGDSAALCVARDTECGVPGATVHLDCCATLMGPDGTSVEALVLVELDDTDGAIADIHLFPLAKLKPRLGYALVALDRQAARARFAEAACVSFTRGTRITLASGRMAPIETLEAGQSVLTRDHGPQKIRWIGHQTVRAHGAFAPIRIKAGTLRNEEDLIVSPNHRLFVYQHRDTLKAGRAEVLIKAKYLLNDDTVTRTDGGFVDYFQLLFDRHEIIYAEGIAAESLMVDTRTRPVLPSELQAQLAGHDTRTDSLGYVLPRTGTAVGQMVGLLQSATRR